MASRNNLKLASFDGGGVRGFSQLRIMGAIMHRLKEDRYSNDPNKVMLPCEHFDLIGGSGTGGLIAIMFARLRLSVAEASDEFSRIINEVYEPDHLFPSERVLDNFSHSGGAPEGLTSSERTDRLRECMETLLRKKGHPVDLELCEKTRSGHCASFVVASLRASALSRVALRTYSVRSQLPSTITVVEAALATCAVPSEFDPVSCGSDQNKIEYIAAGLGANNPIREVITEALELFGGESSIAFLLSLGTGKPGVFPLPLGGQFNLHKLMREMINDCEQKAQEIERQIGRVGIYFRFSVEQGLQDHHSGQVNNPDWISTHAENYISDIPTSENIDALVENYDGATMHITLDQLEYVGGASGPLPSGVTLEMVMAAIGAPPFSLRLVSLLEQASEYFQSESMKKDRVLETLKPLDLEYGPHVAGCMEGTRQDILAKIESWVDDFEAPNILWLKGHPGVGKSAIATSMVARLTHSKRLGSSFFFQRQKAALMKPNALWCTVAFHLARRYLTVGTHIMAALNADETIQSTSNISKLFLQLIQEPLVESEEIPTGRLPVVVIDALDECGGLDKRRFENRRGLMETLKSWSLLPRKFKLIVTSRGESEIDRLLSDMTHRVIEILAGKTVELQSSKDIHKFLTSRLQHQVVDEYGDSLPRDWPGFHIVGDLTTRAAGLFIWAETVVNFISLGEPQQRLNLILKGSSTGGLKGLYGEILSTSFRNPNEEEISNFCSVVGTIILVKEPLSSSSLQQLLSLDATTVKHICNGLKSVMDSQALLQFYHQSFVDFMLDPSRSSSKFVIELEDAARTVTLASLRTMKRHLRFNICDFPSSYLRNVDVPGLASVVNERIPHHVSYSCFFWASHLAETTFNIEVFDCLQYFMLNQFLFWLEVLSLMERVNLGPNSLLWLIKWIKAGLRDNAIASDMWMLNFGVALVQDFLRDQYLFWVQLLSVITQVDLVPSMVWLLMQLRPIRHQRLSDAIAMAIDMKKFVTGFASVISKSVPHIYLSALPFSPQDFPVSRYYRRQYQHTLKILSGGIHSWPAIQRVLSGHIDLVGSVAFSPDGTYIVSGSDDATIRVWDAETGEMVIGPFVGHSEPVNCVAFSPDGRSIVSGSYDNTIRLWDAQTGKMIAGPLTGHTRSITSVAFSPDGRFIISGSGDATIRLWDAAVGNLVAGPFTGHGDWINSIAFSPNGRRVVSGSEDTTIRVWDVGTGENVVRPFDGHTGAVNSVAFSPDGRRIVSGSEDETIRVWDAATGDMIAGPFPGHSSCVAFSPDGSRIVSCSRDATIRVWDAEAGNILAGPFNGHEGWVVCVAFSPDGARIISGSDDRTIRVWDADPGEADPGSFTGHSGGVYSVEFSPDGRFIASGSADGTILLWDAETGDVVAGPFTGHTNGVLSVVFSPDGSRIISGSGDYTIRVWDTKTVKTVVGPFTGHTGVINSVAISPNGRLIVSGSDDRTIRLWDSEEGGMVASPITGHTDAVNSVAFSPIGGRFISGSNDCHIKVWDAETCEMVVGPLIGHSTWVTAVAFSPDGRQIVSCSDDKTVRVWDAETSETVAGPFTGHREWVKSVAFSPDGRHVVSGAMDSTIRLWDVETSTMVAGPVTGHRSCVLSVAFSPDGRRIVSGSRDETIRVWDGMISDSKHAERILSPFSHTSVLKDGWILGSNSELLFSVPDTLHRGLIRPNNSLLIGKFPTTKLDLEQFVHGEAWSCSKNDELVSGG